jgi:hypothetical protein
MGFGLVYRPPAAHPRLPLHNYSHDFLYGGAGDFKPDSGAYSSTIGPAYQRADCSAFVFADSVADI